MSELKHTPGPWTYRKARHADWGDVNDASGDCVIAQCNCNLSGKSLADHRRDGTDPARANGLLIASAPELLDALQQLMDELPSNKDWLNPALEAFARESIAKATGEQP